MLLEDLLNLCREIIEYNAKIDCSLTI
jgi:hypothetical protein